MRPIWKGQISFGLINIAIELYSAEKNKDLQFKLLDNRNKSKVKYERINEKTGEQVPWTEVVKAFEISKKKYVILKEEDFKRVAIENTQTFEIEDFVEKNQIDCSYFAKPYYLVPAKHAEKGYVLLRETLKKMDKVAIGKVVIRTRQYLAALLPNDNALMLNILRFAEELRSSSDLNIPTENINHYKITNKEFDMAEKLVESMAVKWQPKKYHDNYRDALIEWIEKKAKLGHIPLATKSDIKKGSGAEVIDFMALLKKSLTKKKSSHKMRKTVTKKHIVKKTDRREAKKYK